MQYSYLEASCPKCKKRLFVKITAIMRVIRVTSGLGPNFVVCSSCKTKIMANNKEWQQMSSSEKTWYFVLSTLYGCILGLMSSLLPGAILEKMHVRNSFELSSQYTIPLVLIIILSLQEARILMSIDRTENNRSEKTISFWSWETNLHFYGMVWIALMVILSSFITYLL
jgi:hypothetical protein